MEVRPGFNEIKKTASAGDYDILPVSCEILSDICTPIGAMKILKNRSTHCYMLESAWQDENGDAIHFSDLIQSWRSRVSAAR